MKTLRDSQLFAIAQNQNQILRLILVSIPVVVAAPFVAATSIAVWLVGIVFVLIGIIGAVLIYRLASLLEEPWPWLYVVCAVVPYVNTATLLLMNVKATAALKDRGIRVGLMGADKRDLEKLHEQP